MPIDTSASPGWRLPSANAPTCSKKAGAEPSTASVMREAASSSPSLAWGASQGSVHRSRAPAGARTRSTASASARGESTTTSTASVVRRTADFIGTEGRSRMTRELVTNSH